MGRLYEKISIKAAELEERGVTRIPSNLVDIVESLKDMRLEMGHHGRLIREDIRQIRSEVSQLLRKDAK